MQMYATEIVNKTAYFLKINIFQFHGRHTLRQFLIAVIGTVICERQKYLMPQCATDSAITSSVVNTLLISRRILTPPFTLAIPNI